MSNLVKYPKTFHLPWSESISSDDTWHEDPFVLFKNKEVVVSVKMDGECLDGNTIVSTPSGDISIKDICETSTSEVFSFNKNTSEVEVDIITEKMIKNDDNKSWFEIEIESGEKIILTADHMVFLPKFNKYKRVDQLTTEDEFLLIN